MPGLIGLVQAAETIKLLLHKGEPMIGRLLLYSSMEGEFVRVDVNKDQGCPLCGTGPTITAVGHGFVASESCVAK